MKPIAYILIAVGALAFVLAAMICGYFLSINTPENRLVNAASTGDLAAAKSLLSQGVSVNAQDSELGVTALMSAVEDRHADVARLLLENGADVNRKDAKGNTPLMAAALGGQTSLVMALLHRGADVNAENDYAETPLSNAVINGHADVVKMLIDSGANVNWKYIADAEADGKTLLEEAESQKRHDIVKLLKAAGANHDQKRDYGKTRRHRRPESHVEAHSPG